MEGRSMADDGIVMQNRTGKIMSPEDVQDEARRWDEAMVARRRLR